MLTPHILHCSVFLCLLIKLLSFQKVGGGLPGQKAGGAVKAVGVSRMCMHERKTSVAKGKSLEIALYPQQISALINRQRERDARAEGR